MFMHAKLLQSCPTFCDPMDYSPPGSSVYGILQTRILEWVTVSSPRGPSWLIFLIFQELNLHLLSFLQWQVCSLPPEPAMKPPNVYASPKFIWWHSLPQKWWYWAFERWLGHEGRYLMSGISAFKKCTCEDTRSL